MNPIVPTQSSSCLNTASNVNVFVIGTDYTFDLLRVEWNRTRVGLTGLSPFLNVTKNYELCESQTIKRKPSPTLRSGPLY